ncbi:GyrI-like domain-containing protein [Reinekea sp.]|jgi:hypothetical protein|uniref:GyrI-like domain-containing protein n=1 Tax=Reinekea sp. TaxID=1970455 RepID=UPI00398A206C
MPTKYEWRKKEKELYLPKAQPMVLDVPEFKFLTLGGEGSPENQFFSDVVGTLYSLSYGVKMLPKKMTTQPKGYFDYTVYPLEGVWDINDDAKKVFDGTVKKEDFVYQMMIRQPDFLDNNLYFEVFDAVKNKKSNPLLECVEFKTISEGKCIQMLHLGPYENEPVSFIQMEAFAASQGLERVSKLHREIYLSDARKVAPEKLKTVLRFSAK